MIGDAGDIDGEDGPAGDAGDYPDGRTVLVQRGPLFDVQLQVGGNLAGSALRFRDGGEIAADVR